MQMSNTLQIWIAVFFIVLSCATIALVVFIGIVLMQFKRNLKAVELFIKDEIAPTVSEVRLTLSRINNIITNIDGSVSKIGSTISEIRNIVEKVINSSRNVVGVFNKPWIKFIISGAVKGWEFIRKKRKQSADGVGVSGEVWSEEVK